MPLVYRQLRALAGNYMKRERSGHTLQPTALVHEAYIRLIDNSRIDWKGKTHFLAIAAKEMRRVLIDSAKSKGRRKRGGGLHQITLNEGIFQNEAHPVDVLDLHEALERLRELNARQAQVAELRFYAGMTGKEIAEVVGVTERTVKNDWRVAKAWLRTELS